MQTSHSSFMLLSDKPQELCQGDLYTTEALPFSNVCMFPSSEGAKEASAAEDSTTFADKSAEAAQNMKPGKRKRRSAAACFNSSVSPRGFAYCSIE